MVLLTIRIQYAVADLHDVEEHLLAQAVLLPEELVLGVGPGDVPADQLLAGRRHLQQLRVLVLDGHVLGVAQQLPHDGPEVVRDALPHHVLRGREPSCSSGAGDRPLRIHLVGLFPPVDTVNVTPSEDP